MDERIVTQEILDPKALKSEEAFKGDLEQLSKEIPGQWVAYINGVRVATNPELRDLVDEVCSKFKERPVFVEHVARAETSILPTVFFISNQ